MDNGSFDPALREEQVHLLEQQIDPEFLSRMYARFDALELWQQEVFLNTYRHLIQEHEKTEDILASLDLHIDMANEVLRVEAARSGAQESMDPQSQSRPRGVIEVFQAVRATFIDHVFVRLNAELAQE